MNPIQYSGTAENLAVQYSDSLKILMIESYGTGIRKIYSLYSNCPVQPRIEVTNNTLDAVNTGSYSQ